MRRVLIILLTAVVMSACEVADLIRPVDPAIRGDELVVEGWIDEGGYPIVSVTTTLQRPDEPKEVRGLLALVVRDAAVFVSDGTTTWPLQGSLTGDFFPPYVYTTTQMKGEAGKSYTLTVHYAGKVATATTTIPEKTELDTLEVVETDDGVPRVYASFTALEGRCYGFFSKEKSESFGYLPVFLGMVDGNAASGPQTVAVTRGSGLTSIKDYKPGYQPGETACIRFCTMPREIYQFWSDFQSLTGISYIMTFPSSFDNLPSNVEGAYGYWAGYGTSLYEISIPEKE